MKPYDLFAKRVLRAARKAFDAKELGAQKQQAEPCLYSAPCAIGVALPKSVVGALQREGLDNVTLFALETTLRVPLFGELDDLGALQEAHDRWARESGQSNAEYFENTLCRLEKKYGLAA